MYKRKGFKNTLRVTVSFEQQIFNHKYYQHGKNINSTWQQETKLSSRRSFSCFSRNWSGGIKAEIFAWFIFLTDEFPNQMYHEARTAGLAPKVSEGTGQNRSKECCGFPWQLLETPNSEMSNQRGKVTAELGMQILHLCALRE